MVCSKQSSGLRFVLWGPCVSADQSPFSASLSRGSPAREQSGNGTDAAPSGAQRRETGPLRDASYRCRFSGCLRFWPPVLTLTSGDPIFCFGDSVAPFTPPPESAMRTVSVLLRWAQPGERWSWVLQSSSSSLVGCPPSSWSARFSAVSESLWSPGFYLAGHDGEAVDEIIGHVVKRNLQFFSPLQRSGGEASGVISGVTSPSLETKSLPGSPPWHKLREGRKGLMRNNEKHSQRF